MMLVQGLRENAAANAWRSVGLCLVLGVLLGAPSAVWAAEKAGSSGEKPSESQAAQPAAAPQQSDEAADLAKQLANPVASLISVPIQVNYDEDYGPREKGSQWLINVQPVIPISLNDNWNLISRTILPIVDQNDIPIAGRGEWGLGDTLQSLFFSPKEPTSGGWIWGLGPALYLPTATDHSLGKEKWCIGPTGVVLRQQGPWTYGMLANHLFSVAGHDDRPDVNSTFLQPFLTYITKTKTTIALNTETTYDWNSDQAAVPLNLMVNQLLKIGKQPIQVGGGVRYWLHSPDNGPEGWGFRFVLTFLFPK